MVRSTKLFSNYPRKTETIYEINFKMDSFSSRMQYLIDTYASGNKSLFAKKIETSEANVRNYLSGMMPKPNLIEKIAQVFEINIGWLLTGAGEINSETNTDMTLMENYTLQKLVKAQEKLIKVLEKRVEELENSGGINKSVI